MSSGDSRKVSREDVQMVQNRIERLLCCYMNREEVVNALFVEENIEPKFTQIVWQKLEEENQEFFKAYFLKLMVKDQIVKFNQLLSEQAALMRDIGPSGLTSLPLSNGSHVSPMYQNSRRHIPESVHMPAQDGKIDVNRNAVLAQPTNLGMTSSMKGNLIKMEPAYDNRSPFDFAMQGNLVESCSVASISSFSSAESNAHHPNDALLDDTSWIPQHFHFTNLTPDFPNNSDLLESYSGPPFLGSDSNLIDSDGDIDRFHHSSDLIYEGFGGD